MYPLSSNQLLHLRGRRQQAWQNNRTIPKLGRYDITRDQFGTLGFWRRGVGRWRQIRVANDDFALFRALKFFTSDAFDCVRVSLQRFDLIAELDVLGIEAVDVFADFLNFELRPAHRNEAVGTENIVNDESENEQAEHCAAVLLQEFADLIFYGFVHVARTHFVASSVNFAEAFALSAST